MRIIPLEAREQHNRLPREQTDVYNGGPSKRHLSAHTAMPEEGRPRSLSETSTRVCCSTVLNSLMSRNEMIFSEERQREERGETAVSIAGRLVRRGCAVNAIRTILHCVCKRQRSWVFFFFCELFTGEKGERR